MNIYFTRQVPLSYLLCKDNWLDGPRLQQYYSLVQLSHTFMPKFVMPIDSFDLVAVTHHMYFLSVTCVIQSYDISFHTCDLPNLKFFVDSGPWLMSSVDICNMRYHPLGCHLAVPFLVWRAIIVAPLRLCVGSCFSAQEEATFLFCLCTGIADGLVRNTI